MQKQTKNKRSSKLKQFKLVETIIKNAFSNVDKYIQKDLNSSQKISISFK